MRKRGIISIDKKELFYNACTVIFCIIMFFPLYWMIINSIKYEADIFKSPPSLFPERFFFESYTNQLTGNDRSILVAFSNSLICSTGTMILSTILAIPASYGLARFRFKGRKFFIMSFLVTQMLPAVFILTPLFIIFNNLSLQNTYAALIISSSTNAIPFAVLILRTYFLSIPKELDDSARIDGCNSFTAFLRIMIPIAIPGVVVAALFSFLFGWGDLIYGLTFINKQAMRPVTARIYFYIGRYGTSWNYLMAFGVVSILPVLMIFTFMQRYIISGLTSGAVKG
jgi:multiple sugar transport system permease protein